MCSEGLQALYHHIHEHIGRKKTTPEISRHSAASLLFSAPLHYIITLESSAQTNNLHLPSLYIPDAVSLPIYARFRNKKNTRNTIPMKDGLRTTPDNVVTKLLGFGFIAPPVRFLLLLPRGPCSCWSFSSSTPGHHFFTSTCGIDRKIWPGNSAWSHSQARQRHFLDLHTPPRPALSLTIHQSHWEVNLCSAMQGRASACCTPFRLPACIRPLRLDEIHVPTYIRGAMPSRATSVPPNTMSRKTGGLLFSIAKPSYGR